MRESYPVTFELEVSWYEEDPTRFGTDIPSPTIRNVKVNVDVFLKNFSGHLIIFRWLVRDRKCTF